MMGLTELLEAKTEEEAFQYLLGLASEEELELTDWSSGALAPTLLRIQAKLLSELYTGRVAVAEGGLLGSAKGPWLELLAGGFYDETRVDAGFTEGTVLLTDGGAGPHTIQPFQLWGRSTSGLLFTNTVGGQLNQGQTLELTFKAEVSGAAYNVSVDTITTLVTPLASVTITNPDAGEGTWISIQGRDVEGDASLEQKCQNKWPSSGLGMNADAWVYWSVKADPEVHQVKVVTNPNGVAGLTGVIIAGAAGGLSIGVVDAVQADLTPRATNGTAVTVSTAVNEVLALTGTIYIDAAYLVSGEAEGLSALTAYEAGLGIGGPAYRSKLIDALELKGVRNVVLEAPVADVTTPGDASVLRFDVSTLVWVAV